MLSTFFFSIYMKYKGFLQHEDGKYFRIFLIQCGKQLCICMFLFIYVSPLKSKTADPFFNVYIIMSMHIQRKICTIFTFNKKFTEGW